MNIFYLIFILFNLFSFLKYLKFTNLSLGLTSSIPPKNLRATTGSKKLQEYFNKRNATDLLERLHFFSLFLFFLFSGLIVAPSWYSKTANIIISIFPNSQKETKTLFSISFLFCIFLGGCVNEETKLILEKNYLVYHIAEL